MNPLPADDSPSLPVDVLLFLEQLCIRFETAWKTKKPLKIEDLLLDSPAEARPRLVRDLLSFEIALRRNDGDEASLEEYLDRGGTGIIRPALSSPPNPPRPLGI
jgi:hypothetical protein